MEKKILQIEERVVNLHSISDAKLNEYITNMIFTAQKVRYSNPYDQMIDTALIQIALAEKGGRTSAKMTKIALYIAVSGVVVTAIASVVGIFT